MQFSIICIENERQSNISLPSFEESECIESLICCEVVVRAAGAEFDEICAFDELLLALDCIEVSIAAETGVGGFISSIFLRTSAQNFGGNGVRLIIDCATRTAAQYRRNQDHFCTSAF